MNLLKSSVPLTWLLRVFVSLIVALVLALSATWLWLPRWIARSGMAQASAALGRPVQVRAVVFEPWRLGLRLEGLTIGAAPGGHDGGVDLLQVSSVDASLSWRSVWHLAPVLAALTIEHPVLTVARIDAQRSSVDDLVERFSKPLPGGPATSDPDFAVYNIRLLDGELRFDDRLIGEQQRVDRLDLELPFVSTLDTDEKVQVHPALSGRLNGAVFGGAAALRPFDAQHDGQLKFDLAEADLKPYVAYLPKSMPFRLEQGKLGVNMQLDFSRPEKKPPELRLSGELTARDWQLSQAGKPWLGWQALQINISDLRPLQHHVQLSLVRLDGPQFALRRNAAGVLNLPNASANGAAAASARSTSTSDSKWTLGLEAFEMDKGSLDWLDQGPAAHLKITDLDLKLKALQWPLSAQPASFEAAAKLQSASLTLKGQIAAPAIDASAQLAGLQLESLAPYLKVLTPLPLRGQFNSEGSLHWDHPLDANSLPTLGLKNLRFQQVQAGADLKLATLNLDEASVKLAAHEIMVGHLLLTKPQLALRHGAESDWNAVQWLPVPSQTASASPASPASSAPDDWRVSLSGFALDGGRVEVQDTAPARPVRVAASDIHVQAQNLIWGRASRAPVQLSFRLAGLATGSRVEKAEPGGKLSVKGQLQLPQLGFAGRIDADRLPLQTLAPYVEGLAGTGDLRLQSAEMSGTTDIAYRAGRLHAAGQAQLAHVLLRQVRGNTSEDLLKWSQLSVTGLQATVAPNEAPQLSIAQVALSDFYAHLEIDPQGRFNLSGETAAAPGAAASAPQAVPLPASAPLSYHLGPIQLSGGRVDFNDHFVRPNYEASLSELNGSISALISDSAQPADIDLHGKVEGTGQLEITGHLAPRPLQLDLHVNAGDIDLVPLSPYAGKYAGYGIEQGKLSTQLHYQVEPGGKLTAENNVILNQLQFGAVVDSPEATHLPVKFALNLLKDGQGVININLPISGSIDDPEFSVGGLVWRLFLNLIGKALTSPFALLGGGGHEDASVLAFAPAAVQPDEAVRAKLDSLAKALIERPQLQLTISGTAAPEGEQQAVGRQKLAQAVQAELQHNPESRDEALRALYRRTDLKDKPRNLIGLLKDLPTAEMETRLLASYTFDTEAARQLAQSRANAVRDALLARAVPAERLFLKPPRLAEVPPQVDLGLGER